MSNAYGFTFFLHAAYLRISVLYVPYSVTDQERRATMLVHMSVHMMTQIVTDLQRLVVE